MQPNDIQPATPRIHSRTPRPIQFGLFLIGFLWLLIARSAADRSAQGIGTRLNFSQYPTAFLAGAFFLFLLLCGFSALSWVATQSGRIRQTNALPMRPTASQEWQLGAAIGWAMLLLAILPMMLVGDLQPSFWMAPRAWLLVVVTLLTIALNTLALEVAFRGYIFRRLIDAIGPTLATILLSALYAALSIFRPNCTGMSIFITFLLGILLSMAYLRTHALWLGWGLHFAWNAAMGVLFGLPVAGLISYNVLVDTNVRGSFLLTGGAYGPEAAPFTILCIAIAIIVLYRTTKDYAWTYTHAPIVAAGYAMDIAPPKAHADMEQAAAAKPGPLVQILPTTATTASTSPDVEEHLRATKSQGD